MLCDKFGRKFLSGSGEEEENVNSYDDKNNANDVGHQTIMISYLNLSPAQVS